MNFIWGSARQEQISSALASCMTQTTPKVGSDFSQPLARTILPSSRTTGVILRCTFADHHIVSLFFCYSPVPGGPGQLKVAQRCEACELGRSVPNALPTCPLRVRRLVRVVDVVQTMAQFACQSRGRCQKLASPACLSAGICGTAKASLSLSPLSLSLFQSLSKPLDPEFSPS
jgi:hypothetical protein